MIREKKEQYLVISIIPIVLFFYSILHETPYGMVIGLKKILDSNGILLTDYFIVGGKGATFFNASVITLWNIWLLYKMDMKINGLNIAGIFLMLGFSFMGKNLLNILPFYLGAYLYAKISKKNFKSVLVVCMFSTALAPIVSSTARYFSYSVFGILLSILIGTVLGFIIPPVATHTVQAHGGYSLYNTGFATGLVGIMFFSILKAGHFTITPKKEFVKTIDYEIIWILAIIYIILIIYGFIKNRYSFKGYDKLLQHTGRLITDFTITEGFPLVMVNMGILGLFTLIIMLIYFPIINGPILAGMFAVVAFSGFGKHIRNITPIMVGVAIAYFMYKENIALTSFAVTVYFATSLAPIAGKFGIIAGILTGFLHYCLVLNIGAAHGGFNLYNNGLSTGIVATVCVPIFQMFEGGKYEK